MKNKAYQLLNVFEPSEIKLLSDILHKLKDSELDPAKERNYTNGFKQGDLIYPFIKKQVLDRIEILIGRKINLLHGMLLKEKSPWYIHTDYVKGDENPDIAILIPLNAEIINTSTVVFNEECTDKFSTYKLNNKKLENNAASLCDNLMSHETIENLEYVSLQGSYKWIPGSVICWDRKLLHSSDNFLKNGLMEKTGLVLFTTNT